MCYSGGGGFTGHKNGKTYYYGTLIKCNSDKDESIKVECPKCKGKKYLGGGYVTKNVSLCPADNLEVTVWEDTKCDRCNARGYLEAN